MALPSPAVPSELGAPSLNTSPLTSGLAKEEEERSGMEDAQPLIC